MSDTRYSIGPDGLTDEQRAAGYAPRKHSVAAGARQLKAEHDRAFATPLTEAELATGGGYGPAITDVDCTPRPRYGESQAKFLARMASYGANVEALNRDIRQRNRAAALRTVGVETHAGSTRPTYWTVCACGWCGLRVDDPEIARREYDAHVCAAESIGDDAVSRAQAHAGKATMPAKRTAAVLKPALAEQQDSPTVFAERSGVVRSMLDKPTKQDLDELDDASKRYALLEMDRKP